MLSMSLELNITVQLSYQIGNACPHTEMSQKMAGEKSLFKFSDIDFDNFVL